MEQTQEATSFQPVGIDSCIGSIVSLARFALCFELSISSDFVSSHLARSSRPTNLPYPAVIPCFKSKKLLLCWNTLCHFFAVDILLVLLHYSPNNLLIKKNTRMVSSASPVF